MSIEKEEIREKVGARRMRSTRKGKKGRTIPFMIDHNRRRRDSCTKLIQRARVNSCVSIETRPGRHSPVVPWELIRNRRGAGSRPMDNCDYDLWSISGPPSIMLHSDTRKVSRTCNFHRAMFHFNSTDIWLTMVLGTKVDTRLPCWKRWNILWKFQTLSNSTILGPMLIRYLAIHDSWNELRDKLYIYI